MRSLRFFLLLLSVLAAAPAIGQEVPKGDVLTIDSDRLFLESALGQSIQAQLDADGEALLAENQKLDRELTAEEAELAQKRPTMPADEFRLLADAFNKKVENIRTAQDAKQQEIGQRFEADRQRFFNVILPVLSQIVEERNGLVVLERRQVFLSAEEIDITDEVIDRVDRLFTKLNTDVPQNEQ